MRTVLIVVGVIVVLNLIGAAASTAAKPARSY
jgi:hypothetical protein